MSYENQQRAQHARLDVAVLEFRKAEDSDVFYGKIPLQQLANRIVFERPELLADLLTQLGWVFNTLPADVLAQIASAFAEAQTVRSREVLELLHAAAMGRPQVTGRLIQRCCGRPIPVDPINLQGSGPAPIEAREG